MPAFYLRVEAVNLDGVIFDTGNISTRRGGSLLLLDAIRTLRDALPPEVGRRLQPLATGASIGLYAFDADYEENASGVRDAVARFLRDGLGDLPTQHATFVVDVAERKSDAAEAHLLAVAANRWRQMCEPALSLQGVFSQVDARDHCHLDRIRPATRPNRRLDGEQEQVSASVGARFKYGRDARQGFYSGEIGRPVELTFTDELGDLAGGAPTSAPLATRDKMAVLHFDGNKFGELGLARWRAPTDPEDSYRQWSDALKRHHRRLLDELLAAMADDSAWTNADGQARLETLLWGGDEIIWVVPAWKGWEVARWFLTHAHSVEIEKTTIPLSYGAGLVFCHHKSPIQNVLDLANRLVTRTKDWNKQRQSDEKTSALAYAVLESFDDIGAHHNPVLTARQLGALAEPLRALARSADFPMRQLYLLAATRREGRDGKPHLERILKSPAGANFNKFREAVGPDDDAYLHLLNVLPYTPTA